MSDNLVKFNECIAIYAFRYALGRSSYCSYDLNKYLIENKDRFHENNKDLFVKEIEDYEKKHGKIGHDCDHDSWMEVKAAMKGGCGE